MTKTVEGLLSSLGVDDKEMAHFIECDECESWAGWDGAEIHRCENNPIVIESRWLDDLRDMAWCLMYAFGLSKPPPGAFARLMQQMADEYKAVIIEQLNTPLFGVKP